MESTSADGGPATGAGAGAGTRTGSGVGNTPTGAAALERPGSSPEVRNLTADVQALLSRLAHVADPEITRLRAKVERALASAKSTLADGTDRVQRQAKNAMTVGDLYVRDKPWRAVGMAAAAGLVVGVLVARRASGPSRSGTLPAAGN
jgi:ElaB/YqjD/DUF883 family membrane-anchored ribosome-binding protein